MKGIKAILVLALALSGAALFAQDKPVYVDGDYSINYTDVELGKVAITVTVKEGKLSSVGFPEGMGDVALDEAALKDYVAALVAAPDYLAVDAISGATQACDLLKYAVQNALKAAVKK